MAAELRGAQGCSTRGQLPNCRARWRPPRIVPFAGLQQPQSVLDTAHCCNVGGVGSDSSRSVLSMSYQGSSGRLRRRQARGRGAAGAAAAAGDAAEPWTSACASPAPAGIATLPQAGETYSLAETRALVETAMLAAVSGLAYLLSTLLKLETSLGYFLPLPIVIAACRSGVAASWRTMVATACLLLVLLGPLRAVSYVLMHGLLAAALGSLWRLQVPWALSVPVGAVIRMAGQLAYLLLSSLTMNENLFAVLLANVHALLDQLSAAVGASGAPSVMAVICMIFALLLVNALCYVFLLHVVYWLVLSSMGYKLGPLPSVIKRYLYAGAVQPQQPPSS